MALCNRLHYWHFCKHLDWKISPLEFFHNCVFQFEEQNKRKWKKKFVFRFSRFSPWDLSFKENMFSIFVIHFSKHCMSTRNEKTWILGHFRPYSWKKTKIKTFSLCSSFERKGTFGNKDGRATRTGRWIWLS